VFVEQVADRVEFFGREHRLGVMSQFSNGLAERFVSRTARELAPCVREVSGQSVERSHGCIRRQENGANHGRAVVATPVLAVF
jgi:hypothetical protein